MPQKQLTEACLQAIRKRIEEEPWFLSKILYPKYQYKDFHEDWFCDVIKDEEDLCLAPRNSAKTTVRSVIATIYRLIKNPDIQIGIASDTNFQSIHFARETKLQLEQNEILIKLYPYLAPGTPWTDSEFSIKGATDIKKGASVMCISYGGSATGMEFDVLNVDDIVDFENSRTKHQRDKLEDWIGMTLLPMLKSHGIVHWTGTRYHQEDYYSKLLKTNIKTNHSSHKAIKDDGTSYWEEVWSIKKLLKLKEERGSLRFNAQYQNDTTLMEQGSIFKREWFRYFRKEGDYFVTTDGKRIHIKDIAFYQTCDLALSKKETADYLVVLTFGEDKEGNIYITNLLRGRFSWAEQKRFIPEHYRGNSPLNWLGIESNQYQSVLSDEINTLTDISVRQLMPVGDKVTRANSMSAKFETGKVFIWEKLPKLSEFEDELTMFPEGEHDDIVDTVGYIPQCIKRKRAMIGVNV